jgi:cell division protein FtsW
MTQVLRRYFKGDLVIWGVIFLLSVASVLAVFSSSGTLAYRYQQGNVLYYIMKHSAFLFLGWVIIFVTHHFQYKVFSKMASIVYIISIALLVLTLVLGTTYNQAARWLTLPGIGLTFQPSDMAKLGLILYIAKVLAQKQNEIHNLRTVLSHLIMPTGIICLLILPADFSTAALLFTVSVILMFIGRVKSKHLLMILGTGVLAILLFGLIAYALDVGRVHTWIARIQDFTNGNTEESYQVVQSKIAIASGGFFGQGPGNSIQRYFLPHPYSDFIYATIIEEYGILGAISVMTLYMYLLFRAGVIVRKSRRTFQAFATMGLATSLVLQAMINMAVAVNLLPVTGQTLPFISMGGSSIVFTGVAIGIILSVSRSIEKEEKQKKENQIKEDTDESAESE